MSCGCRERALAHLKGARDDMEKQKNLGVSESMLPYTMNILSSAAAFLSIGLITQEEHDFYLNCANDWRPQKKGVRRG